MKTSIKHIISVNVAILGTVDDSRASLSKLHGSDDFGTWVKSLKELDRVLGYGRVGRKVMIEEIAQKLHIDFDLAGQMFEQVEEGIKA